MGVRQQRFVDADVDVMGQICLSRLMSMPVKLKHTAAKGHV